MYVYHIWGVSPIHIFSLVHTNRSMTKKKSKRNWPMRALSTTTVFCFCSRSSKILLKIFDRIEPKIVRKMLLRLKKNVEKLNLLKLRRYREKKLNRELRQTTRKNVKFLGMIKSFDRKSKLNEWTFARWDVGLLESLIIGKKTSRKRCSEISSSFWHICRTSNEATLLANFPSFSPERRKQWSRFSTSEFSLKNKYVWKFFLKIFFEPFFKNMLT